MAHSAKRAVPHDASAGRGLRRRDVLVGAATGGALLVDVAYGASRMSSWAAQPSRARPTGVFAVAGDSEALVFWDDTTDPVPAVVTSSSGQRVTGRTPVRVRGLSNGTPVTFTVRSASGVQSWATDAVTPTHGDPGVVYYVDAGSGSDRHDGRSPSRPLRTAAAAARLPLGPGDAVLFRRGAVWRHDVLGTIARRSGEVHRPVTIAAYGRGAPPRIDGGTVVTGWRRYMTRRTNPEILSNPDMQGIGLVGANSVAYGWHGYTGASGGSLSARTVRTASGRRSVQQLVGGTGTLLFDQTTRTLSASVPYRWTTSLATDAAGAASAAALRLQVRTGSDAASYRYLTSAGSWTATETWFATVRPTTSFADHSVTFTLPADGPVLVQHRNDPASAGRALLVGASTLRATTPAPTSPNTYRLALERETGAFPGMLWVQEQEHRVGSDPDRLADGAWYYDGHHLYYRQDSGPPAQDGRRYEVPTTRSFVTFDSCTDWILRDLDLRMLNARGVGVWSSDTERLAARIVIAENRVRLCGSQIDSAGVPDANGAIAVQVAGDGFVLRGNVIERSNTDSIYVLGTGTISIIHNRVTLAVGSSADCCQLGDAGVRPQGRARIADNVFDNRGSISPKGALLVQGAQITGTVIERNTCRGGHFGIAVQSAGCEVRYNRVSDVGMDASNPAVWAAGIYSDYSGQEIGSTYIHHNLVHDCWNGFNFTSGTRSGHVIVANTVVDSRTAAFASGVQWAGSQLRGNLLYNPGAEADALPPSTPGLAQSGNLVGVDPRFAAGTDYRPTAAAARGKGWTA